MERIKTPSARFDVEVGRDDAGVPHVRARSFREALYALGYLHATDRPTQIFFARAIASGRAAERISNTPELVETDAFFRRAGLFRHVQREVELLPNEKQQELEIYCDGVNDGLKDSGRTLPMWVTGFRPQPWDPQAVLLIGGLLSFAGLAVGQQENERLLLELVQLGVDDQRLHELLEPHLVGVDLELLREINVAKRLSNEALELIADLPRLAGSNAWAVAPGRSANGHALLAADPHLEINRLPAIWYEVVLQWGDEGEGHSAGNDAPGNDDQGNDAAGNDAPSESGPVEIPVSSWGGYAIGATLPGCPLMGVGRTRDVAWGVTFMHGDTSDHFIEDCRRGGATGWQYRRGEDWYDFTLREETIERKGDEPLTLRVYENEQGTLEMDPGSRSDPVLVAGETPASPSSVAGEENREEGPIPETDAEPMGGKYLSVAWIGNMDEGSGRAIGTWIDLLRVENTAAAMDLVRECPHPSLVWVFADCGGHIGRQASGWFPRRSEIHSGIVPVPAWDERNHWHGRIDTRVLPRVVDPPNGFVATANEGMNPPLGPRLVTRPLPDYRKRRIDEELARHSAATVVDMQRLQYDVISIQARDLLPVFLANMPDGEFKESLAAWDYSYAPENRAATVFQNLYRNIVSEVFGHEEGIGWRRILYLATRLGYSTMLLTSVDRILRKDRSTWWRDRDKETLIRRAAVKTAAESSVPWSKTNRFQFVNRFIAGGRAGRLLGFRSAEVALPGNHATPFQGHMLTTATRQSTFAPSYHFVTDLGSDAAWTNLPGGPSESRFSKWYKSDIPRWTAGEYKCLSASGPDVAAG